MLWTKIIGKKFNLLEYYRQNKVLIVSFGVIGSTMLLGHSEQHMTTSSMKAKQAQLSELS